MAKILKRNIVIIILAFLFCASIAFVMIYHDWVGYWIYYKPFYTLFKNELYLPFYLYIGKTLLLYGFILFLAVFPIKKPNKILISAKLFMGIIAVGGLILFGREIYRDIGFIKNENYFVIECNINSLHSDGNHRNRKYKIHSLEQVNGKKVDIEMDFFQYNEVKKERVEKINKIVTVYYLQNTKRMIRYE